MEISVKKRDETFDIIKGVCILLMIIGHCPIGAVLGNLIYSFHMPIFFFIAGYFFKKSEFCKSMITSIRRLFIPFVFVHILCIAIAHILNRFGLFSNVVSSVIDYKNPVESISLMSSGTLPVWFLVALFLCRILFIPLRKIKNDAIVVAVSLIAALIAANLYHYFKLPFAIIPAVTSLGFYVVGHMCSTYNLFANKKTEGLLPFLMGIWIICLMPEKTLDILHNVFRGFYILDLLGALGIFILLYFVIKPCSSNNISLYFLKWCGINSLIILCIHSIEFNFISITGVRRLLRTIYLPYDIYIVVIMRLIFDLTITYFVTKSKVIKRYIFAQND